jgi:hypothetical protein
MRFIKGQSGNVKGRPLGSKQKLPQRESLCELLDRITDDFTENYSTLTTAQKIRILSSFTQLYQDSAINELQQALTGLSGTAITFDFSQDVSSAV